MEGTSARQLRDRRFTVLTRACLPNACVVAGTGWGHVAGAGAAGCRVAVENSLQRFKQWRGLAARYDKLASTYRAAVLLRAILIWLPALAQVS